MLDVGFWILDGGFVGESSCQDYRLHAAARAAKKNHTPTQNAPRRHERAFDLHNAALRRRAAVSCELGRLARRGAGVPEAAGGAFARRSVVGGAPGLPGYARRGVDAVRAGGGHAVARGYGRRQPRQGRRRRALFVARARLQGGHLGPGPAADGPAPAGRRRELRAARRRLRGARGRRGPRRRPRGRQDRPRVERARQGCGCPVRRSRRRRGLAGGGGRQLRQRRRPLGAHAAARLPATAARGAGEGVLGGAVVEEIAAQGGGRRLRPRRGSLAAALLRRPAVQRDAARPHLREAGAPRRHGAAAGGPAGRAVHVRQLLEGGGGLHPGPDLQGRAGLPRQVRGERPGVQLPLHHLPRDAQVHGLQPLRAGEAQLPAQDGGGAPADTAPAGLVARRAAHGRVRREAARRVAGRGRPADVLDGAPGPEQRVRPLPVPAPDLLPGPRPRRRLVRPDLPGDPARRGARLAPQALPRAPRQEEPAGQLLLHGARQRRHLQRAVAHPRRGRRVGHPALDRLLLLGRREGRRPGLRGLAGVHGRRGSPGRR